MWVSFINNGKLGKFLIRRMTDLNKTLPRNLAEASERKKKKQSQRHQVGNWGKEWGGCKVGKWQWEWREGHWAKTIGRLTINRTWQLPRLGVRGSTEARLRETWVFKSLWLEKTEPLIDPGDFRGEFSWDMREGRGWYWIQFGVVLLVIYCSVPKYLES